MTVVLLLCVLGFVLVGAWMGHRHSEVLAWDRELDAAFDSGARKEMPRHRVL
jgi:hypothetical protein